MAVTSVSVGESLLHAYRDLVPAEARLAEALARRGIRPGASVVDQWPVLHDHLNLYSRGLSPAGMLVLQGRPDAGSRHTGIPFTGAPEARRMLGLDARGAASSPSGVAFWRAVEQTRAPHVPLEAFFSTVHLAHATPFDAPDAPETRDASARHLARLLADLRPQVLVTVGRDALPSLARTLLDPDLAALAELPEDAWTDRWPPAAPLHRHPSVQAPGPRPFRARLVPVAALDGPCAADAYAKLASVLALAWP